MFIYRLSIFEFLFIYRFCTPLNTVIGLFKVGTYKIVTYLYSKDNLAIKKKKKRQFSYNRLGNSLFIYASKPIVLVFFPLFSAYFRLVN